jgi:hypothetical protein
MSIGEQGWEEETPFPGVDAVDFKAARALPLDEIAKKYGIHISPHNKKICCPFPDHREKTPSFYYYPETNSFYCFGCKRAGSGVELVSVMDWINKSEAAKKLLAIFGSDLEYTYSSNFDATNAEKKSLLVAFSNSFRKNLKANSQPEFRRRMEEIVYVLDRFNNQHKDIPCEALKVILNQLNIKIGELNAEFPAAW